MNIKIDRKEDIVEVNKITIVANDDTEFTIHINNLNEIVIRKSHLGEGGGAILITPRVSNEIQIS
jgi:hypothetical protein